MKIASKACAGLMLAAASQIHAQDYPKGSVTLVIPLAPGDATDTSARAIADELSRELRVAIVPVNRPGAGGALGTEGAGSVGDFCVLTLNSLTGAGLTTVPFTGASPAVTALLGGHVEGVVLALGTMTGHLRSGTLRGIVISSRYPDFGIWVGFFAPANVPAEVTRALVPALERAIKSPAIGAKLRPLGMLMDYAPPEKLLAEIREEHARVQGLARKAGLLK